MTKIPIVIVVRRRECQVGTGGQWSSRVVVDSLLLWMNLVFDDKNSFCLWGVGDFRRCVLIRFATMMMMISNNPSDG